MKRIISIILTITMLISKSMGITFTQISNGSNITISVEEGKEIKVRALEIVGKEFNNWGVSGAEVGDTGVEEITITAGSSNITAEANYITKRGEYTVTYNANGGENAPESQTKKQDEVLTLRNNVPNKEGSKFLGWSTNNTGIEVEYEAGENFYINSNTTLYAVWKEGDWNSPLLGSGMTPVNWNGSAWVDTTKENWEYNYETASAWSSSNTVAGDGTAMWANARTDDGSMYVWIPRFTYYVDSGNSVSWNADTAGTARTYILFSNGTTDYTTDPSGNTSYTYSVHGAFSPGGIPLTGFWMGKYEASRNDATSSSVGSGTIPASKPGVLSWKSVVANNIFNYGQNLNTALGSHMLKDDEWGAVAYLTNAVGRIPYINNSSTYITGNAGGTQNEASASGITNAWNTINGVKASTTHNIYGVYDMNGGLREYTAAYYSGYESNLYIMNLVNSNVSDGNKYVNKYDVVNPTGDNAATGWDSDYANSLATASPVPLRGGASGNKTNSGVFAFLGFTGNTNSTSGFRMALWGESLGEVSSM